MQAQPGWIPRLLPHKLGSGLEVWGSGSELRASTCVSTDVVVLEVSSSLAQPSLFYHLGVRESFSMTNNVLLCSQADLPDLQALRVGGQRAGGDQPRAGVALPRAPVSECLSPAGGHFPEELGEPNPLLCGFPLTSIITSALHHLSRPPHSPLTSLVPP